MAAGGAKGVTVENVPGAGGTVGLAQLVDQEKGKPNVLMVNGLVMLGAILTNQSPVNLGMTTPIARLTGEYEVVVVPAASEIKTLADLAAKIKADAGSVAIGGGSAGGTDHILAGLIVKAAGGDVTKLNYVPFSGGGEALAAILGGHVVAGISGLSEWSGQIASGELRVLGISAPERQAGIDIPTLKEQGIDVELANWRAIVAPPGLDDAQKKALLDARRPDGEERCLEEGAGRQEVDRPLSAGRPFRQAHRDGERRSPPKSSRASASSSKPRRGERHPQQVRGRSPDRPRTDRHRGRDRDGCDAHARAARSMPRWGRASSPISCPAAWPCRALPSPGRPGRRSFLVEAQDTDWGAVAIIAAGAGAADQPAEAPGLRAGRDHPVHGGAFAFGSRRFLRDGLVAVHPGRGHLSRLHPAARSAAAARHPEGSAVMESFSALMDGFATALTPINLMWSLVGVTLGTLIGILPGIGPALTIALLLPVTRNLDPTGAFIMFAGLYYGAMYGSSTTSILLNTPGESGSIITALEGNQMARRGRGAAALGHGGHRLLRRRHDRHAAAELPRAGLRQARHHVRAGGIFRADGAGLHHRVDAARRLAWCAASPA